MKWSVFLISVVFAAAAPAMPEMPCPAPSAYNPNTPVQLCSHIPWRFLSCASVSRSFDDQQLLLQLADANSSSISTFSSSSGVPLMQCRVLDGVACFGSRVFFIAQDSFAATRWLETERRTRTGSKRFSTALAASLAAGWAGADRLYLGYVGIGILKLLTLGGIGVWWLIDLFLLSMGTLLPADGVPWESWSN